MRKPLTGAILGVLFGLGIAVILQQQGIWPLDRITVFLVPAITGFVGMLLLTLGRPGSTFTYVVAILLLIPMAIWGALGFLEANEFGELNGGCEVIASSSVPDATTVTDSSRRGPFEIDPNGSLTWGAMSPTPFVDYDWEIWVDLGGVEVTIDSDHEDNEGMSEVNGDSIGNVGEYADARGIPAGELRGVYKVGGFAATCDGFGFVKIISDPLETIASKVAAGVILLTLIVLVILMFAGRETAVVANESETVIVEGGDTADGHGGIDGRDDV